MLKAKSLATVMLATASAVVLAAAPALGASAIQYTPIPLTQTELEANWVTDRTTPSGGYESITFEGRADVLEIRIDADQQSSGSNFYFTEGLQRQIESSQAVKVDLWIDPAWSSDGTPVRAGFWGVGHDELGAVSSYPIVEYTTRGEGGFTGWRVWNNTTWVNLPEVPASVGTWSTLEIIHSQETGTFGINVNGVAATTTPNEGSVDLGAVILNQYNYGTAGNDYAVHWNGFATGNLIAVATSKDECRNGGYAAFGFKNQGQCIASIVAADVSGQ